MKRIVLKISGEALSSETGAIDAQKCESLAQKIQNIKQEGFEIILVFGGGNIYRGSKLIASGVDPADSHSMSMLSTVFNAVTMKNFLEKKGERVTIMDALGVEFLERYTPMKAREYIEDGKIVIASSGSGTPFFTTDSTGVLRALELHADAMVKLTKVDGIYDSDPVKNSDALKIPQISYNDFIAQDLKVLDTTAVVLARDNALPVYVASLDSHSSMRELLLGSDTASKIS